MQRLTHHFKSILTLAILVTTMSAHGMESQSQNITEMETGMEFEVQGTRVKFEGQKARMLSEKMTERERLIDSSTKYFSASTVLAGSLAYLLGFDGLSLVSLAMPTLISMPGIWKTIQARRLNTSMEEDLELEAAIQLSLLDQENLVVPQQIELLLPNDLSDEASLTKSEALPCPSAMSVEALCEDWKLLSKVGAKSEEPELGINISNLPQNIHDKIIKIVLASSDTLALEETIKAINIASALRVVRYDNLKDFTKLVYILADKFNVLPNLVAKKFNTSTARIYLGLGLKLSMNPQYPIQLIEQGADINFMNGTPLGNAIKHQNIELVTCLLDSGANVIPYHLTEAVRIEANSKDRLEKVEKATAIKQMIEEVINRQNPEK